MGAICYCPKRIPVKVPLDTHRHSLKPVNSVNRTPSEKEASSWKKIYRRPIELERIVLVVSYNPKPDTSYATIVCKVPL